MTPPTPSRGESAKAWHAFTLYLAQGPKRSRAKVGRELGVSRQNIDKWADRFHWSERVRTAMIADTERVARAADAAALDAARARERERLKFQQRALEASKRATERGLQILKQSAKGSKPSDAARLLAVGDMRGALRWELAGANKPELSVCAQLLNQSSASFFTLMLRASNLKRTRTNFSGSIQRFAGRETDWRM
jgi:hypothetical protein